MTNQRPIRVLHVVESMPRAGLETWLMHVLRNTNRDAVQMDFLTWREGAYDDEIRQLGASIYCCASHKKPFAFAKSVLDILRRQGPFDIVHSHPHFFSGLILKLASHTGVRCRIAHSHVDDSNLAAEASWRRKAYLSVSRRMLHRNATGGIGCSQSAAQALFGKDWRSDPRWRVIYYGVDLGPFDKEFDAASLRAKLNIPAGAFVVGHVGRFEPQKNHDYFMQIAVEILRREPNAWFLLIGEGSLKSVVRRQAERLGIGDRVVMAGVRSDVPQLMQGAMDVLLFPSRYEGLPLVLMEAQSAGLPCYFSEELSSESTIVAPLANRISLRRKPSEWADAIVESRTQGTPVSRSMALQAVRQRGFDIDFSVQRLQEFYREQYRGVRSVDGLRAA